MLPPKHRLPLRTSRKAVESVAKTISSPLFTFLVAKFSDRGDQPSRFAVILGKKIATKAVDRNLLRRQTLGAIAEHLTKLKAGFDIIIIPKKSAITATYPQLHTDVQQTLHRSGII